MSLATLCAKVMPEKGRELPGGPILVPHFRNNFAHPGFCVLFLGYVAVIHDSHFSPGTRSQLFPFILYLIHILAPTRVHLTC